MPQNSTRALARALTCVVLLATTGCSAWRDTEDSTATNDQAAALSVLCVTESDCDDGKPCTEDSCLVAGCTNVPIPGCCNDASECPADSCELPICSVGNCDVVPDPACQGGSGGEGASSSGGSAGRLDSGLPSGSGGVGAGGESGGAGGASSAGGRQSSGGDGAGASGQSVGGQGAVGGATGQGGAPTGMGNGGLVDAGGEGVAGAAFSLGGASGTSVGDGGGAPNAGHGSVMPQPDGSGGSGAVASVGGGSSQPDELPSGGARDTADTDEASDGLAGEGGVGAATGVRNAASPGENPDDGGLELADDSLAGYRLRGGCAVAARDGSGALSGFALLGVAIALLRNRRVVRGRAYRSRRVRRNLRRACTTLFWLVLVFSGERRVASANGFAYDRYAAPVRPTDLLWLERPSAPIGHLQPFGRGSISYANDPLILEAPDGSELAVVGHAVQLNAAVGIELWERAQLALQIPLQFQTGDDAAAELLNRDAQGTALGGVSLDLRFDATERTSSGKFGAAARVTSPWGTADAYASDEAVSLWLRALGGFEFNANGSYLGFGLGPVFRPRRSVPGGVIGSEMRLVAGGLVALSQDTGVTVEASVATTFDDPFDGIATPVEAMAGGRHEMGALVFAAGVGAGLSAGIGTPDARLIFSFGVSSDRVEKSGPPPPPPKDVDGDGVADADDRCPDEPEDLDDFDDEDGCPDDDDDDDDGVVDVEDACPKVPRGEKGHDDGCPNLDQDGDGVPDDVDACVDAPEDPDGWDDHDGCPEDDNDGDEIADVADQCPNESETQNQIDDADGCPDFLRLEDDRIRTLRPVAFARGSEALVKESEALLHELAVLIVSRGDLGILSIEVHVGTQANQQGNLELSQERARSVTEFLISAGVDESRLVAIGHGNTFNLPEEAGAEVGKERVEFILVDRNDDASRGLEASE